MISECWQKMTRGRQNGDIKKTEGWQKGDKNYWKIGWMKSWKPVPAYSMKFFGTIETYARQTSWTSEVTVENIIWLNLLNSLFTFAVMWNWFLEMHEITIWMTVWGFKSMLIRGCSQPIRWAYFKSQSVKSTNLKTRLKHFCCNFSKNSFSNIFKFSSLNLQKNFQNRWIHSRENFGIFRK